MRKVFDRYLSQQLDALLLGNDPMFEAVYQRLTSENKEVYRPLLYYLYLLLEYSFLDKITATKEVQPLHIHVEEELEEPVKLLIAEFLITRRSLATYLQDMLSEVPGIYHQSEITRLKKEKLQLMVCPSSASGANANKAFQEWKKRKSHNKNMLKAYQSLHDYCTLMPNTLFSCNTTFSRKVLGHFCYDPLVAYTSVFREGTSAYVIVNDNSLHSIRQEKVGNEYFLRLIQEVVLFDCETSVSRFEGMNLQELEERNRKAGTTFRNLLLVTFGKEGSSSEGLKRKLEQVRSRFRLGDIRSYTLLTLEIKYLIGQRSTRSIPVQFIGADTSVLYDNFMQVVYSCEVYELRSIRMLNIYSLIFTEAAKVHLLKDIFSESISVPHLISEETKNTILCLSEKEIKELYAALESLLDMLIRDFSIRQAMKRQIRSDSEIIVPESLLEDHLLIHELTLSLGLNPKTNKLSSWVSNGSLYSQHVLVLAYRDQGKFPYYFYPNLLEGSPFGAKEVTVLFISCFFKLPYKWAEHALVKNIHRYMSHPFREQYFGWNEFARQLKAARPQKPSITWELEDRYSYTEERDTFKVRYHGTNKSKTYWASDLFITGKGEQPSYRVERLDELARMDFAEEKLCIQSLGDILERINVYERMINVDRQEEELKVIRAQFHVNDTTPGRLWKILLRKKAQEIGEEGLYEELKDHLHAAGREIVSFSHFYNTWIDPDSPTLTPLSKRVFQSICDYLGLPRSYFFIMQQIRNANVQASRQSTRKMSQLLKDLFNDGCFNNVNRAEKIIRQKLLRYQKLHPLDEMSIREEHIVRDLVTLVRLIAPEIELQPVISIKK